jgi:hypothetical protein
MKRIFIFLTVIFLCGSISAQLQSQMQDRTENWLKRPAQSSENADLRSGGEGSQGGNRAGDEEAEGTVGVSSPVGDSVYVILLFASAYVCCYLPRQGIKIK